MWDRGENPTVNYWMRDLKSLRLLIVVCVLGVARVPAFSQAPNSSQSLSSATEQREAAVLKARTGETGAAIAALRVVIAALSEG